MANAYNQRRRVVVNPQDFGFLSRPSFFLSSSSFLVRMDVHRSFSLMRFMAEAGLLPSPEEELKRELVIQKLKKIVQKWITKVAWQRKLPENVIRDASATILTYGSYGLGEDFFIVLYNILKGRPEVSDIHCVNDAKVPLMRFKFEGVAVDFPYAQFQVMSVPENFQSLLRCIKFWAKHRGVYGNLFGLIHLAVLSAFVCQRSPDAYLSALVMSFFNTFASWPWPTPVLLQDGMMQTVEDVPERRSLMPIGLPCIPYQYCQSNITQSTFNRIRAECLRGQNIVKEVIFKIYLVACVIDELGDWVGWVKSRFPSLILKDYRITHTAQR